jgi:predicted phosphodiesterase
MRFALVTDTHHVDDNTEALQRAFWRKLYQTEKFDAVLHTGDWGRSELEHLKKSFEITREENKDTPIFSVTGNHDFWSTQKSLSLETRMKQVELLAQNYGIDLVERNPFQGNDYWIVGLMGWYHSLHPPTKDREYLPPYTSEGQPHVWFQKYAYESFNQLLNLDFKGKKVLFLSHFALIQEVMNRQDLSGNPHMGSFIKDVADVYCFGHSHKKVETQIGKTRIFNAGAKYDETPSYIIFDL